VSLIVLVLTRYCLLGRGCHIPETFFLIEIVDRQIRLFLLLLTDVENGFSYLFNIIADSLAILRFTICLLLHLILVLLCCRIVKFADCHSGSLNFIPKLHPCFLTFCPLLLYSNKTKNKELRDS